MSGDTNAGALDGGKAQDPMTRAIASGLCVKRVHVAGDESARRAQRGV